MIINNNSQHKTKKNVAGRTLAVKMLRKRQYLFLFYLNNNSENEISIESSESRRGIAAAIGWLMRGAPAHRNREEIKIVPGKTRAVRRRPSPVSEPGNHATVVLVPYPIPPLIIGLGPPPACHVRICFSSTSSCPWFCSFHNLGVAFVISLQRLISSWMDYGWTIATSSAY